MNGEIWADLCANVGTISVRGGDSSGDVADRLDIELDDTYRGFSVSPDDNLNIGYPHGGKEASAPFEYLNYVVIPTNNPLLPDPSKLLDVFGVKLVRYSYADELGYQSNIKILGVEYNNEINAWCLYYGTDSTDYLGVLNTDYPVFCKVYVERLDDAHAEPHLWFQFTRFVDYRVGMDVVFRKDSDSGPFYADVYTKHTRFSMWNDENHLGRLYKVEKTGNIQDATFQVDLNEKEQPNTSDYNPYITLRVDRTWGSGVSPKESNIFSGDERILYTDKYDHNGGSLYPEHRLTFEEFKSWYRTNYAPSIVFANEHDWTNLDSKQWGKDADSDEDKDCYWISDSDYLLEKSIDERYIGTKGVCVVFETGF